MYLRPNLLTGVESFGQLHGGVLKGVEHLRLMLAGNTHATLG